MRRNKKRNSNTGNNKKSRVKKLVVFGGLAALVGTTTLVSCQSCKGNVSNNNSDDSSKNSDANSFNSSNPTSEVYNPELGTNETVTIMFDEETKENTVEAENIKKNDELVSAVVYMTAEDLVKLSESYAEYVNRIGNFNFENCKYNKFEAKDLYSTVYLTNIDCFTNEETQRLIDNGIINDDIGSVVRNSFQFYSFYETDTYHKANKGDTNFIDLSMIFVNDDKAKKVTNTMNKVLSELSTADNTKISSNFVDTYAFFAQGTTLPVSNYDYSKSIYESDRSQLSAGSIYTLNFQGRVIKDLSIEKKATTYAVGKNLNDVLGDISDITRIFEGCLASNKVEKEKVLTK